MIRPLKNQVLLKELPPPSASKAGILFPGTIVREAYEFIVLSRGPAADSALRTGDKVVLDQYRMNSRTAAGEGLWLIADSSITVVIPYEDAGYL